MVGCKGACAHSVCLDMHILFSHHARGWNLEPNDGTQHLRLNMHRNTRLANPTNTPTRTLDTAGPEPLFTDNLAYFPSFPAGPSRVRFAVAPASAAPHAFSVSHTPSLEPTLALLNQHANRKGKELILQVEVLDVSCQVLAAVGV